MSAACFALIRTPMGPVAAADAGLRDGRGRDRRAMREPAHGETRQPVAVTAAMRAAGADLAAGAAALRGSPTALTMVLVAAGGLFAYGMQTVLWAVLADERLGVGTDAITLLYVANGIGGLLATVPAARAGSGRSAARILAAGAAIGGLSVAALGLADGLPPAMALIGLQGFVISIVDILDHHDPPASAGPGGPGPRARGDGLADLGGDGRRHDPRAHPGQRRRTRDRVRRRRLRARGDRGPRIRLRPPRGGAGCAVEARVRAPGRARRCSRPRRASPSRAWPRTAASSGCRPARP